MNLHLNRLSTSTEDRDIFSLLIGNTDFIIASRVQDAGLCSCTTSCIYCMFDSAILFLLPTDARDERTCIGRMHTLSTVCLGESAIAIHRRLAVTSFVSAKRLLRIRVLVVLLDENEDVVDPERWPKYHVNKVGDFHS